MGSCDVLPLCNFPIACRFRISSMGSSSVLVSCDFDQLCQ